MEVCNLYIVLIEKGRETTVPDLVKNSNHRKIYTMEKRLLIVDDNVEIGEIVSIILSDLFIRVETARTVDEAEKFLSDNVYSLIVLDINLEGRNGAEVLKFLVDSADNPNKTVPFIIISGIITPQFIERNKNKFAGILMKPFEHFELRNAAEAILSGVKETPVPEEPESVEVPYLKCELPFPILQLEQRVNKILDTVKKNAKLKQLFAQMNIDRNQNNYIMTHVSMLINVSTAICIQLEWNTDKTLEKFVYASYLHDMALANRPDLAAINTLEKLESLKDTLPPAEYKAVFEHPLTAAKVLEGILEIPPDVAMIIRQHHEMPKENGYPTKCGFQKITPLSVVFIVAHDLVEYILANPKWDIEEYVKKAKSRFKGSHFSKILLSLSDIK